MTDVTTRFKGDKPVNRKRKPRAVKEEATRLHSLIVRTTKGPWCQCGCRQPATDCAHIIPRVFAHTRTDEANSYALAASCHRRFTNHADEWMSFVDRTIGRQEYLRLKNKAEAGVGVKFDWFVDLERLRAIWKTIERRVA